MAGETGSLVAEVSLPIAMTMAAFFGIAIYNSIEIFICIRLTFQRKTSLYFWSMMAANTGIPLHSIAVLLRFFNLAPSLPMAVLVCIGWWLMVTGQSIVLYSRLHLVVDEPLKLRWIAAMIATLFIGLQLPTSGLFIASSDPANPFHAHILNAFNIFERIQIAAFSIQETIISVFYVYESRRSLEPIKAIKPVAVKRVLRELIALCIIVATLDITVMITEYTNNFQIQTTYKPVVYSVKLKAELFVLNHLIRLVQSNSCICQQSSGGSHILMTGNTGNTAAMRTTSISISSPAPTPADPDGIHSEVIALSSQRSRGSKSRVNSGGLGLNSINV